MRWHTKPIMQLVVMLVVMSVVIGAQSTASALLASSTKNIPVAQSQNAELRRVAAEMADPTCPNTDPVQYALTENNVAIAPPKRMRYVDAPWEYDTLNTNYFSRTDSESEFAAAGNLGTKAENLTFMADGQGYDSRIASIMSSIFRYTPTAFRNAYVLKYSGAPRGNDTPHKGDAPAIEVPSKAGWPVCVPTTGYDIGGGYEAMVVAAESNRITLHIGIHEYMVGQDPVLGGCPAGQQCKGGYWLYISGIAVDSDILSAYNGKKGIQQGAGLSQNITDRIQLPVVKPGRRLGTSQGDGVTVLLRDSGPVIYANKNFMWGGGFPEYDPGTTPTATPPAGATNTPPPGAPTATPTAVPTVVPPAAGKGNLLVTVANNIYDLSCSANLVTFWDSDNIHGFDINQYSGFMKDQQVVVIAQNLEPGTYTIDSTYGVYQSGSFSKTYVSTPVEQNVIIRPGQTTETILSLTNAGTNYEECIAVPT
ncbi:hypothetical protein KBB12_03280, partial [Candidatus Woesebacteria bacterium]|nr:hypothetical protein [Candidatus Woesebacteria bacterium]